MSQFLSKKDAVKEFIACGKDPNYFISSYCTLKHPQKQRIPFKLWDFQKQLITDFNDYPHNIILKSRQLGVSWVTAAYAVWLMMFHREKSIMVIATRFKSAANLVQKVKFMIKNLPPWFTERGRGLAFIETDNKTNFTLSNGSEIMASARTQDAGRSESLSLLIIDEAAHVENMEELWAAMGPTMAAGGRCVALSSPKGVGNWFHNQYTKAEKGENEFHPIRLSWQVHPERDDEWERKERKKFNTKEFDQEYNCSFLSSGETVIEAPDLMRIHQLLKNPIIKTGFDKNLWIWELYKPEASYFLVADTARGDGTDFSGFHVFDVETMTQVAEYKAKLGIELYAKLLFDVGTEYGKCMIVPENNALGYEVCQKLIRMGYENLYYEEKGSHDYVPPYNAINAENVIAGFTTSPKNRHFMIGKMEEFVRRGFVTINSERTYKELSTFIWNKGRPEAQKSDDCNDDLVMPLAIACWIRETALKENIKMLDYKKTFLNSMKCSKTTLETKIPGMTGFNHNRSNTILRQQIIDQYKTYAWVSRG